MLYESIDWVSDLVHPVVGQRVDLFRSRSRQEIGKFALKNTRGSAKSVTHAATCSLTTEVAEDHRENPCKSSVFLCELCGRHLELVPIYDFAIPLLKTPQLLTTSATEKLALPRVIQDLLCGSLVYPRKRC